VLEFLKKYFQHKSTEYLETELQFRKESFTLIVLLPLLGYPVITSDLTLLLLPYLDKELEKIISRIRRLDDQYGETLGKFDLG